MQVDILDYSEELKVHFKRLNYEWIERFFVIEPSDRRMLSDPVKHIISKGGFVYFARCGDDIVGTYAMVRVDEGICEIAKMGVTETYQKQGIGTRLLDHAIERAHELELKKLILYSHTDLAPAVNLYFRKGFRVIPKDDYHNERANIKMELVLQS